MDRKTLYMLMNVLQRMTETPGDQIPDLWTDEIPDEYLACWMVRDIGAYEDYFKGTRSPAGVKDDVAMQVFTYAYIYYMRRRRITADGALSEKCWTHFRQYQTLLYDICYARRNGIKIRNFPIFDFDRYPEYLARMQVDLARS